jgi:hypothetical protein
LEVVLNDLESQFALERQNPPFCQVIDLLYQVLKVVRQCHERGFPFNQDPGKLLLSPKKEYITDWKAKNLKGARQTVKAAAELYNKWDVVDSYTGVSRDDVTPFPLWNKL